MGACTEPGSLCIVTEYMPKGDVYSIIHNSQNRLSLVQILSMARDCAQGMAWLHESIPPIIHRDLKPRNLLVDEHYTVKICDFGLSAFQIEEKLREDRATPGTPLFMSPEVLRGETVTEKADVYAYGIVLWEMVTGQEPFCHHEDYSNFVKSIVAGERPPIPDNINPALGQLLTDLWKAKPTRRPSFASVIPRLNLIMVDISIKDPNAADLWTTNFLGETSVPWNVFYPVLYKTLGEPIPKGIESDFKYKAAKAMLATTENSDGSLEVSMERFGHFTGWFGPVQPNVESQPNNFLDRVFNTVSNDWFHGDITKTEAETLLSSWKKRGGFLVRVSLTDPFSNPYTISKLNSLKTVDHQRISVVKGQSSYFTFVKVKGQSKRIEAEGGVENLIKKVERHLELKTPCLGSKYHALFTTQEEDGGGYVSMEDEGEDGKGAEGAK
eukprot:TRINITY_DN4178_c0_g1_i19.p1 TRINITY_DN4178_c0_g1~~TRINITY_DN4178_c0_g1_i19.p1  ORF type:complete len:440 (-),score=96.79 TRINITY_DN4178_c0_g1_i19:139-1458(-)